MKNKPRQYTDEYRKQALELAKDLGSTSAAARQLGISDVNLYNWRMKFEGRSKEMDQKIKQDIPKNPEADQEELKRLRKKVAELEKVNEILKRAAAFFSQDSLK